MKITVITVCYNSVAYIADALKSVDSQSWPDIEHLVIDGGSSDGTLETVSQFEQLWRTVTSEPDAGIYDAMNKGICKATGDVIGFINSDDFFPTSQILATVAEVFKDATIDACYGDLCYVKQHDVRSIVRYWRSSPFKAGLFARGWCPPHPTLFVRRDVYARLGTFDMRFPLAADMELMARFFETHCIRTKYISQIMAHMRLGGTTNRSLRNIVQQNREIWFALQEHQLNPSLLSFICGKMISRGRQLIARPTG